MKNIILDGQILQTDAWYRGMGRYTLQLIHFLSEKVDKDLKISIILNKNIHCDTKRFSVINYLAPKVEQVHTSLPLATDRSTSERSYRNALSHAVKDKFDGQDNYYVITSLFTFSFYAQFPDDCQKVLLFYDITPLLFWKDLGGYFPPHLYMRRFRQIYEADVITTISGTVREDVIKVFGFEPEKVLNINGGFTKPTDKSQRPKHLEKLREYLLFVSGDLPHKNNEVAVEGFAKFKQSTKSKVKLIITSTFSEQSQKKLKRICPDIIFTGNVSDEELEWLYEHAAAVMFASKYEGLGIPILDAVFNDKPVLASSIPVFKEMTKDGFYFFEPDNVNQLATAIRGGLSKKGFAQKSQSYRLILDKYSWENTAKDFLKAALSSKSGITEESEQTKKKIAVVAVNPGIPNQLGRLAESLHYWLSKKYEVDYFFDSTGLNITEMERPTFLDQLGGRVADIMELTPRSYQKYFKTIFLVDNFALEYKVGQFAAVLPGLLLYNYSSSEEAPRMNMIKKLVMDNQLAHLMIEDENLENISDWISEQVNKKNRINPREEILRHRSLNDSMLKKMLRSTKV